MAPDVASDARRPWRARITWSASHVAAGLPTVHETIDPAWFADDPPDAEGWSLRCRFGVPPDQQGNPTEAWIEYWMDDAPHSRLAPGVRLRLFERNGGGFALVELHE